jgi:hypothetical protein
LLGIQPVGENEAACPAVRHLQKGIDVDKQMVVNDA